MTLEFKSMMEGTQPENNINLQPTIEQQEELLRLQHEIHLTGLENEILETEMDESLTHGEQEKRLIDLQVETLVGVDEARKFEEGLGK